MDSSSIMCINDNLITPSANTQISQAKLMNQTVVYNLIKHNPMEIEQKLFENKDLMNQLNSSNLRATFKDQNIYQNSGQQILIEQKTTEEDNAQKNELKQENSKRNIFIEPYSLRKKSIHESYYDNYQGKDLGTKTEQLSTEQNQIIQRKVQQKNRNSRKIQPKKCGNPLCEIPIDELTKLHFYRVKKQNCYVYYCEKCHKAYQNKQFCPFVQCQEIYFDNNVDYEKQWIGCDFCKQWCHIKCEEKYGLKNQEQIQSILKNEQQYACPNCRLQEKKQPCKVKVGQQKQIPITHQQEKINKSISKQQEQDSGSNSIPNPLIYKNQYVESIIHDYQKLQSVKRYEIVSGHLPGLSYLEGPLASQGKQLSLNKDQIHFDLFLLRKLKENPSSFNLNELSQLKEKDRGEEENSTYSLRNKGIEKRKKVKYQRN